MNNPQPENLKEFVESHVQPADDSSVSEFMRELVRREYRQRLRKQLAERLLEGLHSGLGIESTPQMWRNFTSAESTSAKCVDATAAVHRPRVCWSHGRCYKSSGEVRNPASGCCVP